MSDSTASELEQGLIETKLDIARQLVTSLESGQEENAEHLINELTRIGETQLFQEMGKLTRQLHDAITGVQSDEALSKLAVEEMPEARERLHYVVEMTENAANKTMTAVEESLPITDKLLDKAKQLDNSWDKFTHRELDADAFRQLSKDVQVFFSEVIDDTSVVRGHLSDVLMAQDFQDLTGQVIRRVTTMVEEVEENLVKLIKDNGQVIQDSGEVKEKDIVAEGPQMNSEERQDVVSGQDDVDDLLSSLGF